MAESTTIEWTDATWNPITGCSVVSPGCTNCYAMRLAGTRMKNHWSRTGLTSDSKAGPVWNGQVRFNEEWLLQPLSWKRPRMIFVCAHADLFHESVPDEWIDQVFAIMACAPQHTFQVLTKRSDRMVKYLSGEKVALRWFERADNDHALADDWAAGKVSDCKYLPNVWLGVSVEDQKRAAERIPALLDTPAAVRWVSAEPLLGPVDIGKYMHDSDCAGWVADGLCICSEPREVRVDWVVAGGESGHGARPMHTDWARSLRDQCKAAGVPFLFKQWGEHLPVGQTLAGFGTVHGATAVKPGRVKLHYGGTRTEHPKHAFVERGVPFATFSDGALTFAVGKKRAGRLLDGVEHNEFPGCAND